jgi:hypothetical protein
MTFDQELARAFDALSDRLHAEIQHQIDAAMAELRAAAATEAAAASAVAPVAESITVEEPPATVGQPTTSATVNLDGLLAAIRNMDAAGSLTAILDALLASAASHARGVAILLRRGRHSETWGTIGLTGNGSLDEADTIKLPLTIGNETVGELCADGGAPEALAILARHASRCLESMTAFRTARALARQASAPAEDARTDEDASAHRYAKLLVSEIKLYHENEVIAGRRERDLSTRLGGEIARARVLYDQRVPPHVRQRADYFREELVRTLADGDSTLLEFHA